MHCELIIRITRIYSVLLSSAGMITGSRSLLGFYNTEPGVKNDSYLECLCACASLGPGTLRPINKQ